MGLRLSLLGLPSLLGFLVGLSTRTRRNPKNSGTWPRPNPSPRRGCHERSGHWAGRLPARQPMSAPRTELDSQVDLRRQQCLDVLMKRLCVRAPPGAAPGAAGGTAMGAATAKAPKAGERASGAGGSLPAAPPTDWPRLPNEVLALILSWLPPEALATRCRLVCRRWRDLLDGPAVWKLQWRREPAMRAALQAADRCPRLQWSRLGVLRPLGRNLVRNPCGREKFRHWSVQCEWNGGDGWAVEENRDPLEGVEDQTCFASSFRWCQKEQVIDLLEEGFWRELLDTYQPDIVVSDWWGARQDCGCEYELYVALLAADKKRKIGVFEAKPDAIPQWNDASYQKVTHTFRGYGPGVRYVLFRHRGKDTQFWKGHYGARVTNSSVVIQFSSESAESLEPGLSSAPPSQHPSPVLPPKLYF